MTGRLAMEALQAMAMVERMKVVGSMFLHGNVPCLSCGHGDECLLSGVKGIYGPQATAEQVGFRDIGADPAGLQKAAELGKSLATAIRG